MTDKAIIKKAEALFKDKAYGYVNRKKQEWILMYLEIDARELRAVMHELRKGGLMVMPDNAGSFFVVNKDNDYDCKLGIKYMGTEKNRGLHCLENCKPFKKLLPEGQIEIDFETNKRIKETMKEWLRWCDEVKKML